LHFVQIQPCSLKSSSQFIQDCGIEEEDESHETTTDSDKFLKWTATVLSDRHITAKLHQLFRTCTPSVLSSFIAQSYEFFRHR